MSHYQGSVPETEPAPDWRDTAACRGEDPDLFFASNATTQGQAAIRRAKATCWTCPSMNACGQWAMDTRQPFGVWGGVSETERRSILRRRGIRLLTDDEDPAPRGRKPTPPLTLQSVWDTRTQPVQDGHLVFTGYVPVAIGGRHYTPRQIAFEVDRGRAPVGPVRRTCEVNGCVLPAHLRDQREREQARLAVAS